MPLAPGLRLGAYEIQDLLGAGAMGEVYRARDMTLGRVVAIKILPQVFTTDPDRLARFEREARVLASSVAMSVLSIRQNRSGPSEDGPIRFAFSGPDQAPQLIGPGVLSPDGRQVAFVAANPVGARTLWIRSLDSSTGRRIDGTDGAEGPFWAPDGQFVGFGVPSQRRLKKVDLRTGLVQNVCAIADALMGATWSPDGVILFAPDNRVPLYQVSASGGTPRPVTALATERRENSHRWPHFLPDGRHFLYTARSDVRENTGIYVGSLDSEASSWLFEAQSQTLYAAPGFLLFVREGSLLAQRFDPAALALTGEPVAVAESVAHNTASASAFFSVSGNGRVTAFRTDGSRTNQLVWFDRDGKKQESTAVEGPFEQLRMAADGRRAAVVATDVDSGNRDIWIVDLTNGTLTRLTSHPANDWHPVWSPDGAHVAFASDRNGASTVYRRPSDGSGSEELVPTPTVKGNVFPNDWSPDGALLTAHVSTPQTLLDLWIVPLTDDRKPYQLVQTRFTEQMASFSPDGRRVAHVSDESGTPEVYVQAIGGGNRQRVSRSGGLHPRWRGDGRELFFIDGTNRFVAVGVGAGDTFTATTPVALFNACGTAGTTAGEKRYDVLADGARSLWVCPTPMNAPSQVNVLVNWQEGLKQRVPTR